MGARTGRIRDGGACHEHTRRRHRTLCASALDNRGLRSIFKTVRECSLFLPPLLHARIPTHRCSDAQGQRFAYTEDGMGTVSTTTPSAAVFLAPWSLDAWMRPATFAFTATQQIIDYTEDFWQRTILFL